MSAPKRYKVAALWCATCDAYVEFEGPVYGDRADSPVHITPELLAAHRSEAHP